MSKPGAPNQPGWYYRLSSFFRQKFGRPVYKIPLNAGFTCPNRDGTVGEGGCSYCYNPSFAPHYNQTSTGNPTALASQIQQGLKRNQKAGYLAYFQSYTNTYAPLEQLKGLYDEALKHPAVVGLSIATRPDCVNEEILDLLESYARRCHLWIEYGLQSAHNQTLNLINRGHDTGCFDAAVKATRGRGIFICAHIILGLPGETPAMMYETIAHLNRVRIDGVKFHHLQVIKNTPLAEQYRRGEISLFDREAEYVSVVSSCLERLAPQVVVHRLSSQATSKDLLIAPHWTRGAGLIAQDVESELKNRGTYQGCRVS